MRRTDGGYIELLSEAGEATAAILTDPESWGGAVAHRAQPCLIFHGVPVWIMPNGYCRVGEPNAPMVGPRETIALVRASAGLPPAPRDNDND